MRLITLLEESSPKIIYNKEPKNVVADALNRLPKQGDIVDDVEAILPHVPKRRSNISPVHLDRVQVIRVLDESLQIRQ